MSNALLFLTNDFNQSLAALFSNGVNNRARYWLIILVLSQQLDDKSGEERLGFDIISISRR